MKQLLNGTSALFLAAALAAIPANSFGQDDHAGHDHPPATNMAEQADEDHSDHDQDEHTENESEDEHEGHGHEEEEGEHSEEVTLSPEAMERFQITTERAERRVLTGTTTVPARVSYNTEAMAHIGTQVQGRVQQIAVRLGDTVSEGDLLVVIDSPELGTAQSTFLQQHAAVEATRINVEAAESMVEVAQTAFERAELLRESNSVSITDFLERQGALREAEANVRRAQAQLRVAESERLAAENQLHIYGYRHEDCDELLASGEIDTRYEIHAPIGGRVIEREITPGEVVEPSDEALMVLANMDELWVLGDVPERRIGRVTEGTPARVTMTALPDMAFSGTVSYIAPQLDARTRTASVRIVVPSGAPASHDVDHEEDDHTGHDHGEEEDSHDEHATEDADGEVHKAGQLMKPGMFGQAELTLSAAPGQSSEPVLAVPESAIQDVEGGPAVFVTVPGEPNTFEMRPLQVGSRIGRWVHVLGGIEEGDEYVATQTFILKAEHGKAGAEHAH